MTPPTRADPGDRTARIIELLDRCDWVHVDHVWNVSCLWILRPGDWHAVWRRTAIGIESMDTMLDVVATPDRHWSWKDDDEFEQILERRIFDQATGERVRTEASGVIHRWETNASPFNEGWEEWRPDHSWAVPRLRPGWDDASL